MDACVAVAPPSSLLRSNAEQRAPLLFPGRFGHGRRSATGGEETCALPPEGGAAQGRRPAPGFRQDAAGTPPDDEWLIVASETNDVALIDAMEHILPKLGVETRTAAARRVLMRIPGFGPSRG